MQTTTSKTLINRKKLLAMIPLSERTIFNMEQRGEFPSLWAALASIAPRIG